MYLKMVFALLTKSPYSHGKINYLLLGLSRTGIKDGLTQNHLHTFINIHIFNRNKDMMMVIRLYDDNGYDDDDDDDDDDKYTRYM